VKAITAAHGEDITLSKFETIISLPSDTILGLAVIPYHPDKTTQKIQ
jgi:hypothetical protein